MRAATSATGGKAVVPRELPSGTVTLVFTDASLSPSYLWPVLPPAVDGWREGVDHP